MILQYRLTWYFISVVARMPVTSRNAALYKLRLCGLRTPTPIQREGRRERFRHLFACYHGDHGLCLCLRRHR
jgi:hypothetical protein